MFGGMFESFGGLITKRASRLGSRMTSSVSGLDKNQVDDFLKKARTVGQNEKRQNTSSSGIKNRRETFIRGNVEAEEQARSKISKMDRTQLEAISSAFRARQNEVFGRRARPGISQTRLT